MDKLPGERTRLMAARLVLWGNVLFVGSGIILYGLIVIQRLRNEPSFRPLWVYLVLMLVIVVAALVSLRWLEKSLSRAMQFYAWVGIACVSGMVAYDIVFSPADGPGTIIFVPHVGIFTLGLVLGFHPALRYASATALFLLLTGIAYNRISSVFLPIILAYGMVLPSWLVDQLVEEVSEASRRAERAEQFVSELTHDMRNPLALIVTGMAMLQEGELDEEDKVAIWTSLRRNAELLTAIIKDSQEMLEVSEPKPFETVNLQELVQEVAVSYGRPACARKGLDFQVTTEPVMVQGTPVRLVRVVRELIGNAVKYTDEGGIEVHLTTEDGQAKLVVKDTGWGMTAEEVSQVFTRRWRSERAKREKIPGTGLGLTIVHAIVEQHRGDIRIESQPGQGTTVTLWLPLVEQAPTVEQPESAPLTRTPEMEEATGLAGIASADAGS